MKTPPAYAITSVDHALRIAAMLQLEGSLTVAETAERLGVARSTAHRLLQMLVYRDFATQDEARVYHAGPVLELAQHSQSRTALLRAAVLPHAHRLVDLLGETVNATVRVGASVRFVASVESGQALRVTSREGMVFPAYRTSGGLVLLADLSEAELQAVYGDPDESAEEGSDGAVDRPDLERLAAELVKIRRQGFAVNRGRSEKGVVAVGVPIRGSDGAVLAGLAVSMPSPRYEVEHLPSFVGTLSRAATAIEQELAAV
ncbi:IclR family transcriptional regulator [Nocardioides sp.]|uniref:IclR family transcriptional regulator n=1 Tax=Nocardioides sp. TaxID=35761 RepID=UPI002627F10A|nr:IclR family transcriptional regulator [Nocardioides sp.]